MAGGFSVVIGVTDKATAGLDAINKKLVGMTAPITRLNASFAKFTKVSGLNAVTAGVGKLGSTFISLAKSATMVVAPIGAITSGLSVAGIVALTDKFGEFGVQLGITAQNIGISADSLQIYENAMRLAGVSAGSSASSMQNLSTAITDAAGGRNMAALGYFLQLGINIRNANGTLKTASQLMPEVADALHKITNPALRLRVGSAFGLDAASVAVLSKNGAAGLTRNQEIARKYGALNADGIAAAGDMYEAMERVRISVEGLGYSISEKLSPVLSPLLKQLADWIGAHRTDIAKAVEDIALQFKKWVDGGGLARLIEDFKSFAIVVGDVATKLGDLLKQWGLFGDKPALSTNLLTDSAKTSLGVSHNGMRSENAAEGHRQATGRPKVFNLGVSDWLHSLFGTSDNDVMKQDADKRHAVGITDEKFVQLSNVVAGIENSDYDQMGGSSNRFAGKYQMGGDEIKETAARLHVATPSTAEFLGDPAMQERFFSAYTMGHREELMQKSPEFRAQSVDQQLQTLAYAHNQGVGGAMAWLKTGVEGRDAFGTSGKKYSDNLAKVQGDPAGPYSQPAPASTPPAPGAPGGTGTVNVVVSLPNAPPGTKTQVTATGSGIASAKVASTALLDPH